MVSHKISKSCGIISHIRNTLDIKSKKYIYYIVSYTPIIPFCINVWSSTYITNLKTLCTAQKRSVRTLFATAQQPKTLCTAQQRSVRTLFATAQQPNSRDIFINQKFCLWIGPCGLGD